MAYLIVYHKDVELVRRELDSAVTLGRSVECDLSVHDILLSRRHCRIEPDDEGWRLTDLGSKNGTRIGGTPVFRMGLTDGDVIRMGKTAVRFRTGEFVPAANPAPAASDPTASKRPADPFEALAGTVSDFRYQDSTIAPNGIPLPRPRPRPRDPAAYAQDDVQSLVCELVSSSWDSIYETARVPTRPADQGAAVMQTVRRTRPREPRVDLALQAHPEPIEAALPSPTLEEPELDAIEVAFEADVATEVEFQNDIDIDVNLNIDVDIDIEFEFENDPAIEPSPASLNPVVAVLAPPKRKTLGVSLRRLAIVSQWLGLVMLTHYHW